MSEQKAEGRSQHLKLKMLAAVIPLKQDAALAAALVQFPDGAFVFLQLVHCLRWQLHHRLVMSNRQEQHMVRGQGAFSQRHVTLKRKHTMCLWSVHVFTTMSVCVRHLTQLGMYVELTCVPMLMTRCFSTSGLAKQNQHGPVG